MSSRFSDLVAQLKSARRLTPDDIRALRAEVYGAPQVSADELEALVALDKALAEPPPADWGEFLAEASVDCLVRQSEPEDQIDDAKALWATSVFAGATSAAALEALTRILEAAAGAPDSLARFVLDAARDRIVAQRRVGAEDAAMLRRLLFAGGGEGDVGVTRDEANVLFDIDEACGGADCDDAWAILFAQAIADHLTSASPFRLKARAAAAEDAAWLQGAGSTGGFMAGMLRTPDPAGALREVLHPLADEADEWREPEAEMEATLAATAPINDEEARWLVGRLSSGALTAAERRLIETLREQAPQSGGILQPLLGSPADSTPQPAPAFGHRRAAPG